MNTAEKAAPAARPLPPEIAEGDVVTLKTDPKRRRTVLGIVWGMPCCYFTRHIDGGEVVELAVRRSEILTVDRPPAPQLLGALLMPERSQPAQARPGEPKPAESGFLEFTTPAAPATLFPADVPSPGSSIVWRESNEGGDIWSEDGRFKISCVDGGQYTATDFRDVAVSPPVPLIGSATAWCDAQLGNDGCEQLRVSLLWVPLGDDGELRSDCHRFYVVSNHPSGGQWQAEDHGTGDKSGQLAVKAHALAWCEQRAAARPDDRPGDPPAKPGDNPPITF